jgi:hypothetical protein
MFVENLNKFMSNPRGSLLGAFFNGEAQGADPNNLFSPKNNYGGGPTGQGLYLVGERGPELLALEQGSMGHVYNHGQTKSMLKNGLKTGKRETGGPVTGYPQMPGATAQFLFSEGLEGTTKYEGGFDIAYTDPAIVGKDGEILTKIVEEAIKAYKTSGKDLKLSDANLDKALEATEFADGGAVVGEIRNLNKMLKGYMGKITSRDGYF